MHGPPTPSTIGENRYVLEVEIGSGGMATVWRVLDRKTGNHRALKLLRHAAAKTEKTRTRFEQEARTMARLRHRNIVTIQDIGSNADFSWFVMDLCAGGNVAARLKREGPCKPITALSYVFDALLGLDYAHAAGVIHRDMKPHNMLLDTGDVVRLSDFGIARDEQFDQGARLTGMGDTLGTLAYMAPEQRVDPRKAGAAADIYGLGATLYIMVTGRRPFELSLAGIDPTVLERLPVALRPLVRRAVAHNPNDRFPSARAMAQAVSEVCEQLDPDAAPAAQLMLAFGEEDAPTVQDERLR